MILKKSENFIGQHSITMYDLFRSNQKPQRAAHLRYYLIHLMYKYGLPFDTYVDVGTCNSVELNQYCDLFDNVVGFEPNPYASIESRDNLTLYKNALSDREEVRLFHIDKTTPHFSTMNWEKMREYIPHGHEWEDIEITTKKLDAFDLTPNCIKIDTEGEDDAVVQGALKTIQRYKPMLYLEFMSDETKQILIDIGYSIEYSEWIDNFLIHKDYL